MISLSKTRGFLSAIRNLEINSLSVNQGYILGSQVSGLSAHSTCYSAAGVADLS